MNSRSTSIHDNVSDNENARAFLDYFRCPQEFAPFRLAGQLSSSEGFFSFRGIPCFGRTVAGAPEVAKNDSRSPFLPEAEISIFCDPTEVVDNLRRERYVARARSQKVLRNLYYSLRPALPFAVRKFLQKTLFKLRNHSFPNWPVDCSVEQIFELLMKMSVEAAGQEVPFIWFWPDGKNCAAMMTHDVEEQSGVQACEMLMDLDDSFGIKTAFQVIPEGRYAGVEHLIQHIRARGFEANIHDLDHDGRLYDHIERFRERAKKINEYAKKYGLHGFRAGAMHRNQEWFCMLDFEYEMSVPAASHLEPQRGGCCTVMPYFVGDVLELPLTTVQDYGLFYILEEMSIDLWKRQCEIISAHHGLMSFIIHPDYIVQRVERELYCELLRHLSCLKEERDVWLAVPSEINRWWRERKQMRLRRTSEGWCIEGIGSERARLAFASVVNGRLRYRLAGQSETAWAAEGISTEETASRAHI